MDIKGLLAKFLKIDARKSAAEGLASGADPFLMWLSEKKVSKAKAMQVNSGWVYTSIRAIEKELGSIEFQLYKLKGDGSREAVYRHELLDILHAPNQFQTGYEMFYRIAAHLELVGNAYIYLMGVTDESSKPTAMRLLDPKNVKPVKQKFPGFIECYKYTVDGETRTFQPYEILHIKYPDPEDDVEGIGTVQSIAQWIDADNYATEYNRRYFLNGARIGGYLESENALTSEQLDYLKKSFEAIYSGVENAYKVAALPKGTSFKEGQQSQKEMDFVEGQRMSRDKIMAGHQVPKSVIGITEDVNRANAEATNYVFALRTVKPLMTLITVFINEFLVPRYGDDLVLDFKNPVPEDRRLRIEEMAVATGRQPVISVNEAREEFFGYGPVDGGEVVRSAVNLSPIGEPPKVTPSRGAKGAVYKSRFARNKASRKKIADEIAAKTAEALKDFEAKHKTITAKAQKDIGSLTDKDYEVVWKAFVDRLTPYEKRMDAAIKDFNAQQKTAVLANFAKLNKSVTKAVDVDALMGKGQVGVMVDMVKPILSDLYKSEGSAALSLIGAEDMDILNGNAAEALDKAIELMASSYDDTTRLLLKEKLGQGIADGLSYDELATVISDIYEFSDEKRAMTVARTETVRVGNDANKEAWRQSGVVKTVKWYTAPGEVCDFCIPLNGQMIEIDKVFFNQGDEISATDADGNPISMTVEYSDVGAPPLHCNCRCYLRPDEINID